MKPSFMEALALFTFASIAAAYVTYVAGVWFVFRHHGSPSDPVGLRLLKLGALASKVAILWSIWHARPSATPGWWGGALAILAASYGLFWWATITNRRRPLTLAFSPDRPSHLVDEGPYRYLRHPFYASYLLGYVAGWIAVREWYLLPFLAGMTAIYWWAASVEERKFAESPLAEEYERYKQRTYRFFPRLRTAVVPRPITPPPGDAEPRRRRAE